MPFRCASPALVHALLGAAVAAVMVHVLGTAFGTPAPPAEWCLLPAAGVAAIATAARAVSDRRDRIGWGLLAGAVACMAVAHVFFSLTDVTTQTPTLGHAFYVLHYPLAALAIVLLVKPYVRDSRVWLDGLITALVLMSVAAALLFPAVVEVPEGDRFAVATTIAYTAGDLILLGIVVAVFTMTGFRSGLRWVLIGAGLALTATADVLYTRQVAAGTFDAGAWLQTLWPATMLLIGLAAAVAPRPRQILESHSWAVDVGGGVFTLLGLVVLVVDHYEPVGHTALWLAAAALGIRLVRTMLTFRDKTAALHAAQLHADRNEAILDSVAEGVLGIDRRDTIVFANRAAGELLGIDPGELVGQPVDQATMVAAGGSVSASAAAMRADCQPRPASEATFRRADGTELPVEYVIAPVASRRAVAGLVVSFSDVSERRRYAEAQRANRAKNEFLSRMSHELRTPLNAVLGFGQLLAMRDLPADQQDEVDRILKAGRHLLDLIDEVLEISRIEAGRSPLSIEPVAVPQAVDEVVELVEPLAATRGVTIRVDAAALPPAVMADRQRLKQVLLNLLSNAIKFNRDRGRVTVRGASGGAAIAVDDTGVGIAATDLPKLFSAFERLGAAAAGIEGSGLGLILSKSLLEEMDGSIAVDSEPGRGSTFTFELPLATAPAPPAAPGPESERASEPLDGGAAVATVLCIEDNPANLRLVEGIFARRPGIELLTATDATSGIVIARERLPDLVLLDLNLPDLGGDAVLEALQADPRTNRIPVIVVSADATPAQVERLRALGAIDYITKPFDIRRLLDAVDAAVPAIAVA